VDGVGVSPARNVETARAAIEAFNRRDLGAMLAMACDDFEYDWSRSMGLYAGVYRGADGFREFASEQWDVFEEFQVEPHEFVPCGDHHVVVTSTVRATGRGGVPVSALSSHLYEFGDDGKVVRITLFQQRAEALAAAAE
jgi:ketosteroid isomerase-like protein